MAIRAQGVDQRSVLVTEAMEIALEAFKSMLLVLIPVLETIEEIEFDMRTAEDGTKTAVVYDGSTDDVLCELSGEDMKIFILMDQMGSPSQVTQDQKLEMLNLL